MGDFLSPSHPGFTRKEHLLAWWQASRPAFYIATLIPLCLGWVRAGIDTGNWQPGFFALILCCCLFLHLATNLANDLFDHLQGLDAGDSLGGSRVIQEKKIPLASYVKALIVLYTGSIALAGIGVMHTGLAGIWGILFFALFCSFFYVAPPIKYGYRALGELFVFLSMGLVMTTGTYYALTGSWTGEIFALSIPVGLMVAGILYYQSLPEIETDKAAGKHTLANVLGARNALTLLYVWWPFSWFLLVLLFLFGFCSWLVLPGIGISALFYAKLLNCVKREGENWPALDAHGHLARKMYLVCGFFLILAVAFRA